MKLNHFEIKLLLEKYHSRAIESYKGSNVSISTIQNIQIVENGAFVEAMVFIPISEIEVKK